MHHPSLRLASPALAWLLALPLLSVPAAALQPAAHSGAHVGEATIASAPSTAAALSTAIDDLFLRMEGAVLAGDQEAYLALIDHHDPVFVQEHINWVKDLARGLPAAFDMALVGEPVVGDGFDGRADVTAMVEMRYTPGQKEDDTQTWEPRVLRYRARFVPDALDVNLDVPVGQEGVDSRIKLWDSLRYAGEDWDVLEEGTTRVMFPPKYRELADVVVHALPPIRAHVDAQMQSDNSRHTQVVKIYGDMQHLQASIYLNYTAGLSGWNEPGESIKIMGREARGPNVLDGLLAHEYGHAATFWLGDKANAMPWWTLEGIADFVSSAYRDDFGKDNLDPARARDIPESVDRTIRQWAQQNNLPTFPELADFYNFDARLTGHVYRQGHHMVAYITQHFGVAARNDWLSAMARGDSIEDATVGVLGLSFADLDRQWRDSVRPTEDPSAQPATGG